jgi:serine/threonine protein kinase
MLGGECTPRSDLCSLGYVLVELLAGRTPFPKADSYAELIAIKRPGTGLPPAMRALLVGRVAKENIPADALLTLSMIA